MRRSVVFCVVVASLVVASIVGGVVAFFGGDAPVGVGDHVVVEGSSVGHVEGDVAASRVAAERAAKLDALRQLVDVVGGLALDDGRVVHDVVDDAVVRDVALGFRINDTRYYDDGSVDVVAAVATADVDEAIAPARLLRAPKAPAQQ